MHGVERLELLTELVQSLGLVVPVQEFDRAVVQVAETGVALRPFPSEPDLVWTQKVAVVLVPQRVPPKISIKFNESLIFVQASHKSCRQLRNLKVGLNAHNLGVHLSILNACA